MLSDNRSLPGSLWNRKKGYPPEDLHGKSRISTWHLIRLLLPMNPGSVFLKWSQICNATNHPPMNYETVYSKSCKKIKNRITPEARFLLFLHRSIHDRSVSMQDLQGVQAFPQTWSDYDAHIPDRSGFPALLSARFLLLQWMPPKEFHRQVMQVPRESANLLL